MPSGLWRGVSPWRGRAHQRARMTLLTDRFSALRTSPITWVNRPRPSGIHAVNISSPVRKGTDRHETASIRSWLARASAMELPISSNESPSVWDRI